MKKLTFILALVIVSISLSYGQASNTITVKKYLFRYHYTQFGKQIAGTSLANAVKSNENAYKQLKIAQTTHVFATILGLTGGIIVIFPKEPSGLGNMKWELVGFGACLVAVSLPLNRLYKNQTLKAVNTFNTGLQTGFTQYKTDFQLTFSGNGVGIRCNF